jgi:hypothetical protein
VVAPAVDRLALCALCLRFTLETPRVFDLPGAVAQAIVLRLVSEGDPVLGERLRAHSAARPYTVALLREEQGHRQIAIRVSAVGEAIPAALAAAVEQRRSGAPVAPLAFGAVAVQEVALVADPAASPWAARALLWELPERAAALGDLFAVQLASPMLPHRHLASWRDGPPRDAVLSAELLFSAMHDRWLSLGDVPPDPGRAAVLLAAQATTVVQRQVQITPHLGRVKGAGAGGERSGFVGRLTLRLQGDAGQRALLRTLAALSFFLGAGVGTANGMGLVRAIPVKEQLR